MGRAYELNTPDVMVEEFDADLVLLNLRSGEYFNVTGGAHAYLAQVLEGYCPTGLSAEITETDAKAGAESLGFFENMLKHNLLRPAVSAAALVPGTAQAQAVLAAGTDFPFECYDDLSDLLAADPIHDVAPGAGWPVMPDQA